MSPGTSSNPTPPLFREEQHFRQWWLWVMVIVPAGLVWWSLVQQVMLGRPFGNNPGPDWLIWVLWVFIGLGLPVLFWLISLTVEVTQEAVHVRYRPLTRRIIPLGDIVRAEPRTYSPVKEYGGWGIKGWSRAKVAYNVRGDRGVELALADGRSVMLGSQRSDELAAAIQAGLSRQRHAGR